MSYPDIGLGVVQGIKVPVDPGTVDSASDLKESIVPGRIGPRVIRGLALHDVKGLPTRPGQMRGTHEVLVG